MLKSTPLYPPEARAPMVGIIASGVFTALILLPSWSTASQAVIQFASLGAADGLNSGPIHSIAQSRQGFILFGTERGVQAYDGYKMRSKERGPTGTDPVTAMLTDSKGNLWLGTRHREVLLVQAQSGESIRHMIPLEAGAAITTICEGKDKTWVGSSSGLFTINPSGKVEALDEFKGLQVVGVARQGTDVFAASRSGLVWRFGNSDKSLVWKHEAGVQSLHPSPTGLWLGAPSELIHWRPGNVERFPTPLGVRDLSAFLQDSSGTLWIGTDRGLLRFDHVRGRFDHFLPDPLDPKGLGGSRITTLMEDRRNMLWIGFEEGGVSRCNVRQRHLVHYRPTATEPKGMKFVRDFAVRDDNTVWIASEGGLQMFDLLKETWTVYSNERDASPALPQSISAVAPKPDGSLLLGTASTGVWLLDPKAGTCEALSNQPDSLSITTLLNTRAGQIWLGTAKGLYQMHEGEIRLVPGLENKWISDLAETEGTLWVGATDGLWKQADGAFTPSTLSPGTNVTCLLPTADGTLWVGTKQGLFKTKGQAVLRQYTQKPHGLPHDSIAGLAMDREGNLWISTLDGLARLDPNKEEYRRFDLDDGLQSMLFHERAAISDSHGWLFFGGPEGFNLIKPDQLPPMPEPQRPVLSGFEFNGDRTGAGVLQRPLSATAKIEIPYNEINRIAFSFANLDYTKSQRSVFRYRLDGFDQTWLDAGSDRKATYTGLGPGRYQFVVQSSVDGSNWHPDDATMPLIILAPWYQQWWAYLCFILMPVGIIAAIATVTVRSRIARARREELEAAKHFAEIANRAKSDFLAKVTHELRTPLNAILGFCHLLNEDEKMNPSQRETLETINSSGEHLLSLINDVLDMSKIEAGRLELHCEEFDPRLLFQNVRKMLVFKAQQKQLSLDLELEAEVPRFIKADMGKIRQILVNLVGNAIKFTETGSISLRVKSEVQEEKSRLQIEIQDSGRGIAREELDSLFQMFYQAEAGRKSMQGTGLGLSISRKFIEFMGGAIEVHSELGRGTLFRFDVPYESVSASRMQSRTPSRKSRQLAPGQVIRILIAEDQPANRVLLFTLLRNAGFDVELAENGKQAVELWGNCLPHLTFMDVNMPEMNGDEATRLIVTQNRARDPIVVALTASALEETRTLMLEAGCRDFLTKPFTPNRVFDLIEKHLGVVYLEPEPQPHPQLAA